MIKVNLLPQEAAGAGSRPGAAAGGGGGALVALILVVAFAAVFLIGFWVFYTDSQSKQAVAEATAKRDKTKKAIAALEGDFKDLKRLKQVYENQLEVLQSLDPVDRLLWCEKLNLLPELIPSGIYLTRIRMDEDVKEVETAESIKRRQDWDKDTSKTKGTKPTAVKKPIIRQTLAIEGVAYVEGGQSDRRLELVTTLLRSLREKEATVPYTKKKKSFMQNFEGDIAFDPIVGDRIEGREVSKFTFKLRSRAM